MRRAAYAGIAGNVHAFKLVSNVAYVPLARDRPGLAAGKAKLAPSVYPHLHALFLTRRELITPVH